MSQGLARSLSRRSLIQKAIEIAQRQYVPVKDVFMRNQRRSVLPPAAITDVSDAIQFIVSVHTRAPSHQTTPTLASLASSSICSFLEASPQLTPFNSSNARVEKSFSEAAKESKSFVSDSTGNGGSRMEVKNEWKLARRKSKERVEEWLKSGLSPNDFIKLVEIVKLGGQIPSVDSYRELVKMCFVLIDISSDNQTVKMPRKSWTVRKHQKTNTAKIHPAIVGLVRHMAQDCGTEDTKSALYSCALQVSSSPAQVDVIYKQFNKIGLGNKLGKNQLIEAYLQTEDTLRPSLTTYLSQCLPADHKDKSTPLSVHTFERVMSTCARKYQLSASIGVYSCMTRQYGMAPTRKIFSAITSLMSATFENDQSSRWKLGLCSQLIADTVNAYNGEAPVWVYAEMAKPLVILLGTDGYKQMLQASGEAAQSYCRYYEGVNKTDLLKDSWNMSVYHSLIKCSIRSRNTSLALNLLDDLKTLHTHLPTPASSGLAHSTHGVPGCSTFRLLLELVNSTEHITTYLPVLLEEMSSILSVEQLNLLRGPLLMALEQVYTAYSLSMPSGPSLDLKPHLRAKPTDLVGHQALPGFVSAAAHGLIDAAIDSKANELLLQRLAHLGCHEDKETNLNTCSSVVSVCSDESPWTGSAALAL